MDKKPVELTPLLEVKNLQTAFSINDSWHNAVDDVSFQVGRKRIIGVVGESGCGKSVLSLSVIGLLPKVNSQIRSGSVLFNGKNLTHLSEDEMNDVRGKDISMIFQEPMTSLNPVLTIGYQLQEVLFNHMNISKAEAREKALRF